MSTPTTKASDRLVEALRRIADPLGEGSLVFTDLFEATAHAEATAADASDLPPGPLNGRIVSVKALFDVAGHVTTAGTRVLRSRPAATADALAVTRLRRGGAVIPGRTVMTEFAFSAVGIIPHGGTPGNPHDRSRIAGGSSTGAAVSVATGMSEIALGTDTGGSIRIPAALCGLVGFKPTAGRIPLQGAFPLSPTLDVCGPIARDVADCAAAFEVLSGEPPPDRLRFRTEHLRLSVLRGGPDEDTDAIVADAFADALARLAAGGATLREVSLEPELKALAELDAIGTFPSVELATSLDETGSSSLADVDPRTAERIRAGRSVTKRQHALMLDRRRDMVAMMGARLRDGEVLALPTVPMTAVPIAEAQEPDAFRSVNSRLLRNPRIANLFDLPALSLPVPGGTLPVGLTLMAGRGQDSRLLAFALEVERLLRT